jgi:2-iminobutanoate/2-iminopropanoate deaminase
VTSKKPVATTAAPGAIGPYSQAIRLGNLLFCSGQIPLDPGTGQLVEGDIKAQTRKVLQNVAAVLEAGGSAPARLVKTTVFLTDLKQFQSFNEEYENFFKTQAPGAAYPARSTVEVSALPRGSMVEIEVIAECG